MSALEQQVTDTLRAVAQEAPHDLGLLSRVQVATRRRTRVRRVGALAGSAAVVVAAVAAATLVGGADTQTGLRYGEAPEQFFREATTAVSFPFAADPPLAGLGPDPLVDVEGPVVRMTWSGGPGVDPVQVLVSAEPIARIAGSVTATRVRGKNGELVCAQTQACRLSWEERPGRYVAVHVHGTASSTASDQALAAAQALRPANVTVSFDLQVRLQPRGCELYAYSSADVRFRGAAERCAVTVGLAPAGAFEGRAVRIGGRDGYQRPSDDGRQHYLLHEAYGQALDVSVPLSWTRELLDAFVRGITVRS